MDSSLALSIVNCNLNVHSVVRIIEHLWNYGRNLDIVIWLDTGEAAAALNVVLEDKFVTCKSLNTLSFDFIKLLFFLLFISNLFSIFNIGNPL